MLKPKWRNGAEAWGHSLIEVLVAMLVILTALLPAGYAVASAIRLGRKGEAESRVALALAARTSLVQQVAGATTPRCLALAPGQATTADVIEWWTITGGGTTRHLRLHARAAGAGWAVADSVDVTVQCG